MPARLPYPGSDNGTWGDVLNTYLAVSHGSDGMLKDNSVNNSTIADGAIANSKIATNAAIEQSKVAGLVTDLNSKLTVANNLSDLASTASARTNLGLGSAAVMSPAQIASDAAFANTYIDKAIFDAKGDLLVGTGDATVQRLAAATVSGSPLVSDSSTTSGVKWGTAQEQAARALGWVFVTDPQYAGGAVSDLSDGDDTAAIEAAWAAANSTGQVLYFPPGTYNYSGSGLGGTNRPMIQGAGKYKTTIKLGASSYLMNNSLFFAGLLLSDLTTQGGLGVIKHTFTNVNVQGQHIVTDCDFRGYTECAIASDASDMPYWKIDKCVFHSANTTSTIGIALSGNTDQCCITRCDFTMNRIGVKLRKGGNNAHIEFCDFIHFSTINSGGPRISVWLVPQSTSVNSGAGFTLAKCKFGNENLVTGDYRIVYADEGGGATNGLKFPILDADSTGFIQGHSIGDILVNGASLALPPVIYSTTSNLAGSRYGPITVGGTPPTYMVEFRTPPGASRGNQDNILGPVIGADLGTETASVPRPSNGVGVFTVHDPNGLFSTEPTTPLSFAGAGDPVGYSRVLTSVLSAFVVQAGTTRTPATDAHGGTDAAVIDLTGSGGGVRANLDSAALTIDQPTWIEFDAMAGTLDTIRPYIQYTSNGAFHWRRVVRLGSTWARYRFLWVPRDKSTTIILWFQSVSGTLGSFSLGRVRVYQSREPLNVDGVVLIGQTKYQLSVSGGAVQATVVT